MIVLRSAGLSVLVLGGSACSVLFSTAEPAGGVFDAGVGEDAGDEVQSGDFYISPDGDDNNDGSRDSPFQSWNHAVSQLRPGHTLVARDGEYDEAISGPLHVNCGSNGNCAGSACSDGTPDAPIRIIAEHEREAWLSSSATTAESILRVEDCRFWQFDGLRISGSDAPDANEEFDDAVVVLKDSQDIALQNLLVHDSNRFVAGSLVRVRRTPGALLEGLEFYQFHLLALNIEQSSEVQVARSYFGGNGSNYGDIMGGVDSRPGCEERGDQAVLMEGATNSSVDNVAIEDVCAGIVIRPDDEDSESDNIVVGGSVVRNVRGNGIAIHSFCDDGCPVDGCTLTVCDDTNQSKRIRLVNNAVVNADAAVDANGVVDLSISNLTSINNNDGVDIELGDANNVLLEPKVAIQNSILMDGNNGLDLSESPPVAVGITHTVLFRNGEDFNGAVEEFSIGMNFEKDPELGTCQAYLPAMSLLQNAGVSGTPVGANIVNRTSQGVDLDVPLWNPQTGQFPCGAQVAEFAANNCTNIHERFFVDVASCPLP